MNFSRYYAPIFLMILIVSSSIHASEKSSSPRTRKRASPCLRITSLLFGLGLLSNPAQALRLPPNVEGKEMVALDTFYSEGDDRTCEYQILTFMKPPYLPCAPRGCLYDEFGAPNKLECPPFTQFLKFNQSSICPKAAIDGCYTKADTTRMFISSWDDETISSSRYPSFILEAPKSARARKRKNK